MSEATSGPGALRIAAAVVLCAVAIAGVGLQIGLVYAPVTQGDAMGMGMERAFRALMAWSIAPVQLGCVGLACGLVLSSQLAHRVGRLGVAAAVVDWLGMAVVAGVMVGIGPSPGAAASAGLAALCVWLAGFFAVGLAIGAARSWGSLAVALVPVPLALLAPPLLYLAQS